MNNELSKMKKMQQVVRKVKKFFLLFQMLFNLHALNAIFSQPKMSYDQT